MKRYRIMTILVTLLFIAGFTGCGSSSGTSTDSSSSSTTSDSSSDSSDSSSSDSSSSTTTDKSQYAVSVAASSATYSANDIVGNVTFDINVVIDFTANTARLSDGTAQTITTTGITLVTEDSTTLTVTQTTYGITIQSTLAGNVKYTLTGSLDGTLTVTSTGLYQLYLDGTVITASAGPALDLESTSKVFIVTASGTTNTLTDSTSRSMTMKAALYGKGPMVFTGDGALTVTGSYKHGIFSNDYIRVTDGTMNVAVSAKDAIRSVNGFIFDDGALTINATGTTTDDESKGIKVEGAETTGTGKGYVVINGGYITITSVSKAITANWDIDDDATTSSTADDPTPYVQINNGVITIKTTGTPYEYTSNGTTVSCSPEGIEGKSSVTINNGFITVNTSDDCVNAGNSIVINGGCLYCYSTGNDAIDSNGTLTIAGGVVVAIGTSSPEGAIDCDNNTLAITGGTLVGIGGTVSRPTSASCTQNVVVLGSLTSGTTMALKNSSGTTVFAFTIPKAYETMILSSPKIASSTKYTVYTGGTASSDATFYGLFLDNLSYSGGTAGSSLTTTSVITKIGGTYF